MTTMNTSRSQQMADVFLARNTPFKRKQVLAARTFSAPPDVVFKQFCPTREMDWIDGWTADLIWTETGYAETGCIFTTPESNVLGSGLWIITRFDMNEHFELFRIIDNHVVQQFQIDLADHGNGTCTGTWTLTFTALSQAGNAIVESIPDADPVFRRVLDGLEHFVTTGALMTVDR